MYYLTKSFFDYRVLLTLIGVVVLAAFCPAYASAGQYPDLNGDSLVDLADLRILSDQWLTAGNPPDYNSADLDGSNSVDSIDYAFLAEEFRPPRLPLQGEYGMPVGTFDANINVKRNPDQIDKTWETKDFYTIHTDLSPAWLIRNKTNWIAFFNRIEQWGLSRPTYFAYMDSAGVQTVQGDQIINDPQMTEGWILAWFAGGNGWDKWDVPWLIVLQHQPTSIENGTDGLEFTFSGQCGYVTAMPLYGYYKPPAESVTDPLVQAGLPSKNIRTWQWHQQLPQSVVDRCRWWASATRYFPTYCHETFSVDPYNDRLRLKEDFDWIHIADDWGTTPIKFATMSPTLGLAWLYGTFPMNVSEPVHDPWCFTPYGPYLGILNKDSFTIDLDVLQYIHETEVQQDPNMAIGCMNEIVTELQNAMADKFPTSDGSYWFDHGENNFVWASMSDCWYPKALKYMDPQTRSNALKSLDNYFHEAYLTPERYHVDNSYSHHQYYVAFGPGCWDGWYANTDSGKLATARLYTLWSYAHYADDWDLIRQRWDLVRWSHSTEINMSWRTFGRYAIAEMGDEATPSMALARLAYKAGNHMDTYLYASYIFARELVHHYVKQMGADYFRRNQPYQSMEIMPENIFLTNMWGDTAGWRIDGRNYSPNGDHQFDNRYVRFQSEDIARFHRDTMGQWLPDEINSYVGTEYPYETARDVAHIEPSQVRLRSFFLNETPTQLNNFAPIDTWRGNAYHCGIAAMTLSAIRTGQPLEFKRLIPALPAFPFVTGLERHISSTWKGTVLDFYSRSDDRWPLPNWSRWSPPQHPTDSDNMFCFGYITPNPDLDPLDTNLTSWNWVTNVISYDVP